MSSPVASAGWEAFQPLRPAIAGLVGLAGLAVALTAHLLRAAARAVIVGSIVIAIAAVALMVLSTLNWA